MLQWPLEYPHLFGKGPKTITNKQIPCYCLLLGAISRSVVNFELFRKEATLFCLSCLAGTYLFCLLRTDSPWWRVAWFAVITGVLVTSLTRGGGGLGWQLKFDRCFIARGCLAEVAQGVPA